MPDGWSDTLSERLPQGQGRREILFLFPKSADLSSKPEKSYKIKLLWAKNLRIPFFFCTFGRFF